MANVLVGTTDISITDELVSLSKFYLQSYSQVTRPLLNKSGSFSHAPITAVDMMLSTPAKQAKEGGYGGGGGGWHLILVANG